MIKKENIFFKNKFIGTIHYDKGVYVAFRTRIHEFKIFNSGFGASKKLLDCLRLKGIKIFVINFENAEGYWCQVDDFYNYGKDWNDNGDEQKILERQFWNRDEINIQTEKQSKL